MKEAKVQDKNIKIEDQVLYARHHPSHVLVNGMFLSKTKNPMSRGPRRIVHNITPDGKMFFEFVLHAELGAFELKLLQSLVALAGPKGFSFEDFRDSGGVVAGDDEYRFFSLPGAIFIEVSVNDICRLMGLSKSGSAVKAVKEGIDKLRACLIDLKDRRTRYEKVSSTSMISSLQGEVDRLTQKGHLRIGLNQFLAESILGVDRYVKVSLSEVRALKSDAAVFIHQKLCGWMDVGRKKSVSMDVLQSYVWLSDGSETERTLRYRREVVRKAMGEFRDIGWLVEERKGKEGQIVFDITRLNFTTKQLDLID